MATIFLSYRHEDKATADGLAELLANDHTVRYDKELFVGTAWRDYLLDALLSCDCVVVLWSKNTRQSDFVPGEVGAARATPRIGLLPVLIGEVEIPPFLQDLMVERIRDPTPETLKELAETLNDAIEKHIQHRHRRKQGRPKIFISHRHKDEEIVRQLVDCLTTYFHIERQDLRCTSVSPYRLPVGENTADRLRNEITDAEVVLGILSPDTLESTYVAFELGSAWGQRVWTCPLLTRGATQAHIPDPIRDLSPLFLTNPRDCRQLLDDMADFTSLAKRSPVVNLDEKIEVLVAMARGTAPDANSADSAAPTGSIPSITAAV